MRTEGMPIHHMHRPHMAVHMPHPTHWFTEHQAIMPLLIASLLILLFAGLVFFIYRFGGSSGFGGGASAVHPQFPYYPFY